MVDNCSPFEATSPVLLLVFCFSDRVSLIVPRVASNSRFPPCLSSRGDRRATLYLACTSSLCGQLRMPVHFLSSLSSPRLMPQAGVVSACPLERAVSQLRQGLLLFQSVTLWDEDVFVTVSLCSRPGHPHTVDPFHIFLSKLQHACDPRM
jgi:hypothetical protein